MDHIHVPFLQYVLDVNNQLILRFSAHFQYLETTYGEGSAKADILGQIMGCNKDHLLNLSATNETYFVESWWAKNQMNAIPVSLKEKFVLDQIMHLRFYFFLKMVSTVEFQCRKLVRNLYPPNGGRSEFYNIYRLLLTNLNLTRAHEETFNIARMVRNTVHNLGMHTSESNIVTFNNHNYHFTQWQQISFFTSDFNLEVQKKLIEAIVDITGTDEFHNAQF